MRVLFLLAVASWLTAGGQASIWPYHGSATGAVIDDYYEEQPRQYHVNAPVIGSLAANPIVVAGPVTSSKAIVGPSAGPVLVQGPREGSAAVVGPTQGSATIVGPTQGAATVIGPTDGGAKIIGPTAGAATIIGPTGGGSVIGPSSGGSIIVGPTDGGAKIIGPTAGGATIVGPTDGAATIVGPTAQGATIIGPTDAGATIIGAQAGGATIVGSGVDSYSHHHHHHIIEPPTVQQHVHIVGSNVQDAYSHAEAHAHADAHAHAEAHAHADAHNYVSQPVYHHVNYVERPVYIKERPVYYQHNHPIAVNTIYDEHKHVVCAPSLAGWSTSAAARAVASAASRYGPVHVSSVQGRPVVTISGPNCGPHDNHIHREGFYHHHDHYSNPPIAINGPSSAGVVIRGPSGEIIATNGVVDQVSVPKRPVQWYPVRYSKC